MKTKLMPMASDTEGRARDLKLILVQAREHQALTEMQLDRDGRVWDRLLKAWNVKED